jgi:hypothetical protein
MAHAPYLREKARELRLSKKLTIDELAERLALPRTTIYWVKDLPIPGSGPGGGWPESARRRGNHAMQTKYRRLREEAYLDGVTSFDDLAVDHTFRDFVGLFLAEGYKRDRNTVAIANSDPAVLVVSQRWLHRLTDKRLRYAIQYHADQCLDELRAFWGETLEIDGDAISLQRKSNSNQLAGRIWRSRYGVMTIRTYDTALRAKLEAWMDRLRSEWTLESTLRDVAQPGSAHRLGR